MSVPRPHKNEILEIAAEFSLRLSDDTVNTYLTQFESLIGAYQVVDEMQMISPALKYPRSSGYHPQPEENKYNAWYVKTEIHGAPHGKLKGMRAAIKDNIAVAHVPMMNGSSVLEGYVPEMDATVVTRLLDAGAVIAGKAHCEYYCLSGGSHTAAKGAVENPRKAGYSAGGSSSGSAALVACGEVDFAIGADQGGSIRTPASFCGLVGMKPTWGLVPYTGIMPIELTVDHVGPISRNVADNALVLEAIAGPDGLDPRQGLAGGPQAYTGGLDLGLKGLRVAVISEGFGWENSEIDVDEKVRNASGMLRRLGATVDEVSIPMHRHGQSIWTPIVNEGATQQMMKGNGFGFNWKGLYMPSLMEAHAQWRHRADELSETLKFTMVAGEFMTRVGKGTFYAKAQNLARQLRGAYDTVLADYDVLLMPTLPMKATPLPPVDAPLELVFQRAWEMMANTSPFDVTGHPALQVPCGMSDGLPIGMMLIGRCFDEAKLYQVASAYEKEVDWQMF
ncbi:amidase [Noviherbaspirillum cavernae]|uniref:Amidase n=1 Tax=Noviherbaspirillum cavernae TaxID=2320862 RepID=A0A418WVX3_9BURK|nr:amidase [Noviherbaspirillum cavernae]RJF96808.1 amidase [Noviherbaspirillum cavernae]